MGRVSRTQLVWHLAIDRAAVCWLCSFVRRLAQGHTESAGTAIRLAVDEAHASETRLRLLPAYVEILVAAGDVQAARIAADELSTVAGDLDAPALNAVAAQARGAVLLADDDARAALTVLRQAWTAWQEVEAAYDAARVRVLIGLASRQLGDVDAAEMEFDAARWVFQQLGARPDLTRVDAFRRAVRPGTVGGLSAREIQVLRLVAAGKHPFRPPRDNGWSSRCEVGSACPTLVHMDSTERSPRVIANRRRCESSHSRRRIRGCARRGSHSSDAARPEETANHRHAPPCGPSAA